MDKPVLFLYLGLMELDVNSLRSDTPGCRNVIHFNNAGASLMPKPVRDAVAGYFDEETLFGGYETARRRKEEIEQTYGSAARLIGADASEIALLENATAAWHMAFFSISFRNGDRILTSASEYASNYISYLRLKKDKDVTIEVIPNDSYGQTDPEALNSMMDEKVRLVGITHIPTNNGLVNPAEEIGAVVRKYDCFYLLDACQSAGQYPLDVQEIGCDMLSATGRKYLRGPRGTGFLYVNSKKLEELHPPLPDLHSAEWVERDAYKLRNDARRFENWESNYAAVVGLNAAITYALNLGMPAIWRRIGELAEKLRAKLATVNGIDVHDIGKGKCGIVTFTLKGKEAEAIRNELEKRGINVSISGRSSTRIDMEERGLDQMVRASVHYYNTEEEIDFLVEVLKKMA